MLCGYSAAELLHAGCGPPSAEAEVLVPERDCRRHTGLRVHRGRLFADEVCDVDGIELTTPMFTAWKLARRSSLVEAVVAVDALAHVHGLDPRDIVRVGYRRIGARGSRGLPEVVRLANPLAGSPMETRIRMAIVLAGLPPPVLQHPVGPYYLDMAYPELMLGIEYDGREHLDPDRALRDSPGRATSAGAAGRCSASLLARSTGPAGSQRRSEGRSLRSGRQRPTRGGGDALGDPSRLLAKPAARSRPARVRGEASGCWACSASRCSTARSTICGHSSRCDQRCSSPTSAPPHANASTTTTAAAHSLGRQHGARSTTTGTSSGPNSTEPNSSGCTTCGVSRTGRGTRRAGRKACRPPRAPTRASVRRTRPPRSG